MLGNMKEMKARERSALEKGAACCDVHRRAWLWAATLIVANVSFDVGLAPGRSFGISHPTIALLVNSLSSRPQNFSHLVSGSRQVYRRERHSDNVGIFFRDSFERRNNIVLGFLGFFSIVLCVVGARAETLKFLLYSLENKIEWCTLEFNENFTSYSLYNVVG